MTIENNQINERSEFWDETTNLGFFRRFAEYDPEHWSVEYQKAQMSRRKSQTCCCSLENVFEDVALRVRTSN